MRQLADAERPTSISNRMRERRFRLFDEMADTLPRPLSIIDIGGTNEFWEQRGWAGRDDVTVTLVNLAEQEQRHENIVSTTGDATDLRDHGDKSFDIAFSNSVIEHLFTRENQAAMAREIARVGKAYWVQTPNFWFPMEPHFLVPGWQWMPEDARVAVLRRRGVGWMGRCEDPAVARRVVQEVRLLRRSEVADLFPEASIVAERFGGIAKSWMALHGFPAPAPAEVAA
jgi:hypothetical protein